MDLGISGFRGFGIRIRGLYDVGGWADVWGWRWPVERGNVEGVGRGEVGARALW